MKKGIILVALSIMLLFSSCTINLNAGIPFNTGNESGNEASNRNTYELSAEQIYDRCSQAVFYIEVFDELNNLFATGSGFFVSDEGLGVTNAHVLKNGCSARITLPYSKRTYSVSLCNIDEDNDWATIVADHAEGVSFLKIGDASSIVGGTAIYAIGSPLGLQNSISSGIISNERRSIGTIDYIQITAPISPGSSGGALINKFGEVIGITTAGFEEGQNLNLAIPITDVDFSQKPTLSLKNATEKSARSNPIKYLCSYLERYGEKQKSIIMGEYYTIRLRDYNEPTAHAECNLIVYLEDGFINEQSLLISYVVHYDSGSSVFCDYEFFSNSISMSVVSKSGSVSTATATVDKQKYTPKQKVTITELGKENSVNRSYFEEYIPLFFTNTLAGLERYTYEQSLLVHLYDFGFVSLS